LIATIYAVTSLIPSLPNSPPASRQARYILPINQISFHIFHTVLMLHRVGLTSTSHDFAREPTTPQQPFPKSISPPCSFSNIKILILCRIGNVEFGHGSINQHVNNVVVSLVQNVLHYLHPVQQLFSVPPFVVLACVTTLKSVKVEDSPLKNSKKPDLKSRKQRNWELQSIIGDATQTKKVWK
jgi:hypothetical protein